VVIYKKVCYAENGTECIAQPGNHAFVKLCKEQRIEQCFTKVKNPKSGGKAELVVRATMEISHTKTEFYSSAHGKNFETAIKPQHNSLVGLAPVEKFI